MGKLKRTADEKDMFVREYLVDLNATRAVERAGLGGATRQGRQQQASRFMRDPDVRARIEDALAERRARLEIKGDTYVKILHDLCTFDPAALYDDDGEPLPLHLVPADVRRAITHIQVVMKNAEAGDQKIDRVLSVRWADRRASVELMMRHLGLLIERKETGKPGSFQHLAPAEKQKRLAELLAKLDAVGQAPKLPKGKAASKPH